MNICHQSHRTLTSILFVCVCSWSTPGEAARNSTPIVATESPTERVDRVADEYLAAVLDMQPEQAYFVGLAPPRHDGLTDISPAAIEAWHQREDAWLAAIGGVDEGALDGTPEWAALANLREQLESSIGLRVCHQEWWAGVNQMGAWHTSLATIAELQPVITAIDRQQALRRWERVPHYIRQEISNLRTGLKNGYSTPRPVAERMLKQIDGLADAPLKDHPYASPAKRSTDAHFSRAYYEILRAAVIPALREYRRFLLTEYVPAARRTLAVTALPYGSECYAALLRANTTLKRAPQEVFDVGSRVVKRQTEEVRSVGRDVFGIDDFAAIVERAKSLPDGHYASGQELLDASREMVDRAQHVLGPLFGQLPTQAVIVEPIPPYEDNGGASSHYEEPAASGRPGIFRISLTHATTMTRGDAEITAFHETWPGHHLQLAYAQRIKAAHPVSRLLENSGFIEGWARYAEALAEEAGLYRTVSAKILRRTWPARGMVVDPGLHALRWTRDEVVAFVEASGRFPSSEAEEMVDRIAAIPGQLTAYDSGAQVFFELRHLAETTLGPRFNLPEFHDALLENGSIPLPMLRAHIQQWIESRGMAR